MAQQVKNLPAMQETRVRSPDQEEPLEDGVATHSSILAWRIPGTAEPGGLPSMGSHRVRHDGSDLAAAALAAGFPWGDYLFLGGNNFDPLTAAVMPPAVGRDNLVGWRL